MSLKFVFFALAALCWSSAALADAGFSYIRPRHFVVCGINSEYKSLAHKKDGIWQGFDADICRAVAAAILGNAESFKLIPVKSTAIGKALNGGKIDIMLGHSSLTAAEEAEQYVIPVDTLFLDRQIFASRKATNASSMRDVTGAKVSVPQNSPAEVFLNEYNQKYALNFNILTQPSLTSLKEAFYLNRCELISGDEIFINDIVTNFPSKEPAVVLPEEIAYIPVKIYTAGNNTTLNIALRWIINALKLADAAGITAQNIDIFAASRSRSLQNLLGIKENVWNKLNLNPLWFRSYISLYGSYYQILERNLGKGSPLQLNMEQNKLITNGGYLSFQPFL